VKVSGDLLGEPPVELLVRVEHQSVTLRTLLAGRHERRVFVALEQTGHFGVREERVHTLEETRVEDVRFVHDEADLLAFATRSSKNGSEILVKVGAGVLVRDLDLKDAETKRDNVVCH
jgi:hypothetical protein